MCFGEEVCPETERKHLQGYIYFHKKRRFNGVLAVLPEGINIRAAKGSDEDNAFYTSKERRGWYVVGDPPSQGKRSDLEMVKELIDNGGN